MIWHECFRKYVDKWNFRRGQMSIILLTKQVKPVKQISDWDWVQVQRNVCSTIIRHLNTWNISFSRKVLKSVTFFMHSEVYFINDKRRKIWRLFELTFFTLSKICGKYDQLNIRTADISLISLTFKKKFR